MKSYADLIYFQEHTIQIKSEDQLKLKAVIIIQEIIFKEKFK